MKTSALRGRDSFLGKRVLVVGLGKSGLAATKVLKKYGAIVFLTDVRKKSELKDQLKKIPAGVTVETGAQNFLQQQFDLIVLSPGVPWDLPPLVKARRSGIPVWPELELGWRLCRPFKTIALTGTNGKTTTTALIGHLLKTSGRLTVVGGNIGTPLSNIVSKINSRTHLVLEVSSYQLEAHQTFHPNVGIVLNVTPDHLKRHKTMRRYAAAKGRLFELMTRHDTAIYNQDDRWCRWMVKSIKAKKIPFPMKKLFEIASNIRLLGQHNRQNAMAAILAVRAVGLKDHEIISGLNSFKAVPHRIEPIRTIGGVLYVNDSKGTNVDSTLVAMAAFKNPIRLILGGEHKGSSYKPLIPLIKKKVREILTIGEAAPLIELELKGTVRLTRTRTLKKAVQHAARVAQAGEVVLLSPACASFDQFKNFEHRGETFVNLVKKLKA